MPKTFYKYFGLLILGGLFISSCNMPSNATPEVISQPEQATATIELTATQTEVVPTGTPTATATEPQLPEPSATANIEIPVAEVVRETNCRVGPAGNYDLVATYQVGQKLEIAAKDLGGGYWFTRNPDKPEELCYLLAQNITISGDTSALLKFTPRPSPTAAPYFSVTFKKFDTCEGEDFTLFVIENLGSVPFRSAYIKVTDQKVNKSVEQALNAFDLRVRCVLAKNIAPLEQGATGYLTSPPINWSARGNKLRAVIMLCTEKDLKGSCITQSLDVKE
ncbi:MAG TPA: hypothetical protein VFD54_08725 [Anaerolineales bacterium]|nr:hypothetical protein [Anaerolineales bacterium]